MVSFIHVVAAIVSQEELSAKASHEAGIQNSHESRTYSDSRCQACINPRESAVNLPEASLSSSRSRDIARGITIIDS